MILTADHLAKMSQNLSKPNANMESVLIGLRLRGRDAGLSNAAILPHYLCQMGHESMGWVHDKEIWGPTPAQNRYEGRVDLGNTQPGDGKKFSGKGPFQGTGRSNTTEFYKWCLGLSLPFPVPNFVDNPNLINIDPWEGLSAIWYWETRNLNKRASTNNLEAVTRVINGGVNGLVDRYRYYTRCSLVLLGFGPQDVKGFQIAAGFSDRDVDGIAGRDTRDALHQTLLKEPEILFEKPASVETIHTPDEVGSMGLESSKDALILAVETFLKQLKEF